jgi:hypothetical protein
MKKIIVYFLLIFASTVILAPIVNAQCPEGKSPVTMVTPSGKTKILCINDNAVQGIENASDNSSTTVVPASCTKGCWTPADVESWSVDGDLTCTWKDAHELYCTNVPVSGAKLVFSLVIEADYAVCSSIVNNHIEEKIKKDEGMDACIALLEPYTEPEIAGLNCPCLSDYESIIKEINPTDTLGCNVDLYSLEVTVNTVDMFSFYPGQTGKQTCGIRNTSLFDITDDEAQSCIDFLEVFAISNEITCK